MTQIILENLPKQMNNQTENNGNNNEPDKETPKKEAERRAKAPSNSSFEIGTKMMNIFVGSRII
jgi:hypothetical protein